jgi:hypothetical protein
MLKRSLLWDKKPRAKSVGRRRQKLDLMGHRILRNAIAGAIWQKRLTLRANQDLDPAAPAA